MNQSPNPSPWRKLGALAAAAAMLVILPAGVETAAAANPAPAASATTPAADEKQYLELTLTRTDTNGTTVEVGDRLTWSLGYKNVTTDTAFTVYPKESNMDGVVTAQSNGAPVCRWSSLGAGKTAECKGTATNSFTYHVVTADDVKNGFTPTATVAATSDMNGQNVLQTVTITGDKVNVNEPTVPDGTEKIKVTMKRTDSLGNNVKLGDNLKYTFTVQNLTDQQIVAYPKSSNIERVDAPTYPNNSCRLVLNANATGTCDFANHTINAQDVLDRQYTPDATWLATKDRDGKQVLQTDIVLTGDKVTVAGPAADAASTPSERKDGAELQLATNGQIKGEYYRIPALAEAPNGWILAAWDLRPDGGDAPSPNSIVQRISKDGGKSWTSPRLVAAGRNAAGKWGYSDPSYVVDHETGKVFLFFVKSYDQGYFGSVQGVEDVRNVLQAVVVESDDNGETWSEPRNITKEITAGHENEWKSRFASSGAGIQLKYGAHKGRLIQQYAVRTTGNANIAVSVYSDDHGKTWKSGNPVTGANMDENKVVELSDGRVMLNSRPGGAGYRRVAISSDGGVNYTGLHDDKNLPDPNNNAQITRAYPDAPEGSAKAKILLYSSPRANNEGRNNGVVRISFDDGETWSAGKLFKSGYMAYSVITALSAEAGGGFGLFYEGSGMTYTRVSMEWLGYLTATATGSATVTATETGAATVNVPVTVTNDGVTDYSDVVVTPEGFPGGWRADPVTVGSVPAGKSVTVAVPVTADYGAVAGNVVGATLKLTGKYAQSGETLKSFDEGSLTVTVTEAEPEPEPEPTIESVTAVTTQTDAKVGDSFDAGKVTVTAKLSDGKTRDLAANEYQLTAVDGSGTAVDLTKPFAAAGTVTVTATVVGVEPPITGTFSIAVAAVEPEPEPTVTIESVTAVTTQTNAKVGDKFDAGKVTVTAKLSDGTTRDLAASEYRLTAVDGSGAVVDLTKPFAAAGTVTVTATVVDTDPAVFGSFSIAVAAKPGADDGAPKKPGLSKTGASVTGVATAVVLLTLAGGITVMLRRRA
ncbi:exo-alpha-sialidase [Bifidobacterium leontopitheci]|uniref:exo-alpha-sialidase n=1 Tax=Bifidobacterium leontopitheci TaxID=2650774 RepID=A0A6I1GAW8_9BIFI|nr:exo-alpha-sialidase [Bifidobacterium leontopitheci]KAB7788695.1 sialidase [Bifidobacterium leontopitheci]